MSEIFPDFPNWLANPRYQRDDASPEWALPVFADAIQNPLGAVIPGIDNRSVSSSMSAF